MIYIINSNMYNKLTILTSDMLSKLAIAMSMPSTSASPVTYLFFLRKRMIQIHNKWKI